MKTMLKNQKMISVNQLAAQIKLVEVWKAKNVQNYLVKIEFRASNENEMGMRGAASRRAEETRRMRQARSNFLGDATRLRNKVPINITKAETFGEQRKE